MAGTSVNDAAPSPGALPNVCTMVAWLKMGGCVYAPGAEPGLEPYDAGAKTMRYHRIVAAENVVRNADFDETAWRGRGQDVRQALLSSSGGSGDDVPDIF